MSNHIKIEAVEGFYSIRAKGAVLGESRAVLKLSEDGRDPIYYVPRDDLAMPFFETSETTSSCPLKGRANYFHLQSKSGVVEDVAWSYERPLPDASPIANYMTFDLDRVTLEHM